MDHEAVVEGKEGPGLVLVVDDEPAIRRIMRRILEHRGWGVVEAESGSEAIAIVEGREDLAVALVDYSMPGLDGVAVLQRLSVIAPGLPVVVMSGYREESASMAGAAGFLAKPFDSGGLVATVEAAAGACAEGSGRD